MQFGVQIQGGYRGPKVRQEASNLTRFISPRPDGGDSSRLSKNRVSVSSQDKLPSYPPGTPGTTTTSKQQRTTG